MLYHTVFVAGVLNELCRSVHPCYLRPNKESVCTVNTNSVTLYVVTLLTVKKIKFEFALNLQLSIAATS